MNLDWMWVKSFLAVVDTGSLSQAAKQLGVSQPTLSRHIQALERQSKLNLFRRNHQGLSLTDEGLSLLESAQHMQAAAESFSRKVTGQETVLKGDIRISANEVVAVYLLPQAIKAFRQLHPEVNIDIIVSNHASSLRKREVDIALRMFQPNELDLIATRLPDLALGLYASIEYLTQHPEPKTLEDCKHHQLIGLDPEYLFLNAFKKTISIPIKRSDFCIRTDSLLTGIALMRAGAGLLVTHRHIAEKYDDVKAILTDASWPTLQFWLVSHHDVKNNLRFKTLMTFLRDWFADDVYKGAVTL